MPYAVVADAVVVVHLGFVVFVAVGGFLAWRWPRVLYLHVPAVCWALGIVTVGWPCPLTGVEKSLREQAGSEAYEGAFIDRYVTGVLYPEGYERLAQGAVAVGVIVAYTGLWRRRRSARTAEAGIRTPGTQRS